MGFKSQKYVEVSHLTTDNANEFGITTEQLVFLNDLLYRCSMPRHNMVLDNVYKDGVTAVRFKLTSTEASKLITNLLNDLEFEFIEYNTKRWHEVKLQETKLKTNKDYQDYETNQDLK